MDQIIEVVRARLRGIPVGKAIDSLALATEIAEDTASLDEVRAVIRAEAKAAGIAVVDE
ncbi:MAG: hypothetical protein GY844_19320 [Bradyrhizobium sp.]|nr:hypothetical protein [Bradyrhizobium sp.]